MFITIKVTNKLTLEETLHTYIADNLKQLLITLLSDYNRLYDYELIECGKM